MFFLDYIPPHLAFAFEVKNGNQNEYSLTDDNIQENVSVEFNHDLRQVYM